MVVKNINYKPGLRNIMKAYFPDKSLNPLAQNLMSTIMDGINSQLLTKFDEELKSAPKSNKEDSLLNVSKKSVEKTFKGNVRKLALAEGKRQLILLEKGALKYDSATDLEVLRAAEKSEKSKKSPPKQVVIKPHDLFTTGIQKLIKSSHPDLSIDPKGKACLSTHLCSLAKRIADKSSEKIGEDTLTPSVLREVLTNILDPEILTLALNEGHRCLILHNNGLLSFKPKKTTHAVSYEEDEESLNPREGVDEVPSSVFRRGLNAFLERFGSSAKMGKKESEFMETTIMEIAQCISARVADTSFQTEQSEIGDSEVNTAVEGVLPKELVQHAQNQAKSCVDLFHRGTFKYTSKKPVVKPPEQSVKKIKTTKKTLPPPKKRVSETREEPAKETKKPKREIKPDFTDGLLDVADNYFSEMQVSLSTDTTSHINLILLNICKKLVVSVAEKSKGVKEELSSQNVKKAINRILPAELAKHAIFHGTNNVIMSPGKEQSTSSTSE